MPQQQTRGAVATVVARATAEGEAGLAVIRLSGPRALDIAARVFRGPTPRPRRAVYGIFHEPLADVDDPDAVLTVIDEGLLLTLPGPHSYTGEDTAELFCHGGRQVAALLVRACQAAGAVAAPPGEFTRRAFLNGRLTLDQAEAVADLIQAGSEQAARAAVAQLRGGLDAELGAVEWPLLDLLVRLEGALEFSDDDADEAGLPAAEVRLALDEARDGLERLLELAPAGRQLREGIQVVLAGAPNAGKSSLFNRLVGSDRALVDAAPGTTRDVVTARVRRGGRLYVLHDTAGLRDGGPGTEAPGHVEAMGIARARTTAAEADLVLELVPADLMASAGLAASAGPAAAGVRAATDRGADGATEPKAPPRLRVLTKCDLRAGAGAAAVGIGLATSSLTGAGIDALWSAIEKQVATWRLDEAESLGVVLNERHRQRLLECRDELTQLLALFDAPVAPGDEVTGTLLAALLARLGEVSGRVFTEQMLDGIFQRFCVGK